MQYLLREIFYRRVNIVVLLVRLFNVEMLHYKLRFVH